eukprot:5832854-Prymnesium_polylepis.1
MFATTYACAHGILSRAQVCTTIVRLYGGPWRINVPRVCPADASGGRPCVYTCRTHSGMTSVRSPAPLGGRTVSVFWGEDAPYSYKGVLRKTPISLGAARPRVR